jgi:class 3 adenylate cyclase
LLRDRETLLTYLPVRTVDEYLADGRSVLAARAGTAAVLFADIRNFTTICESVDPQRLVYWLDRFFTVMSEEILAHEGIVLQLMGDGVLAVFGIPTALRNCCQAAVTTAVRMQYLLDNLNRTDPLQIGLQVDMGTGIHYGPLVAGSVGGTARKMYTVLGDTVNTAQRIEAVSKSAGYPILISRQVHEALDPLARPGGILLGKFDLKGKAQSTEILAYSYRRGDDLLPDFSYRA